jgi:hypothetical protein
MKATFIETTEFTRAISEFLPDHTYAKFQQRLMLNPDQGAVMAGCGGLRKVRMADSKRGKGKRGGARVIYLYVPTAKRFYLLDVYDKDEKDDLSAHEKKQLRHLSELLKKEAIASYHRWHQENK